MCLGSVGSSCSICGKQTGMLAIISVSTFVIVAILHDIFDGILSLRDTRNHIFKHIKCWLLEQMQHFPSLDTYAVQVSYLDWHRLLSQTNRILYISLTVNCLKQTANIVVHVITKENWESSRLTFTFLQLFVYEFILRAIPQNVFVYFLRFCR